MGKVACIVDFPPRGIWSAFLKAGMGTGELWTGLEIERRAMEGMEDWNWDWANRGIGRKRQRRDRQVLGW